MLPKRIKEQRNIKGLSQSILAKYIGVSQQALGSWEVGRTDPDKKSLTKLSDFFNVSVDYLLGLTDIPDKIDDYARKKATEIPSPVEQIQLTADEQELIEQFRQLSDRDKGKIEGKIEEMLEDDYKSSVKGA